MKASSKRRTNTAERPLTKLQNHRRLLAAARTLFAERGYHETTTRDIARLAGVVHGTFYAHFNDKAECFSTFLQDIEHEVCLLTEWNLPSKQTPAATISSWIESVLSYSEANPGVISAVFTDIKPLSRKRRRRGSSPSFLKKQLALFDEWKRTGQVTRDFDPKIFYNLCIGAIRIGNAIVETTYKSRKKVINEMTLFLVHSIGAK